MMKTPDYINKKYSQNYLVAIDKIKFILSKNRYDILDKVIVDIGAGKGIITTELLEYAKFVYAIEIDQKNVYDLERTLKSNKLKIVSQDVREIDFSDFGEKITLFANIPFFLTSEILKDKILESDNIENAFIFMQREAVFRYLSSAKNFKHSYLSVLFNAYYNIEPIYSFVKEDFFPKPGVDVILVRFAKKHGIETDPMFFDFIAFMFNLRKVNIKSTLLTLFSYIQIKKYILKSVGIRLNQLCSELTVEQWLRIYEHFKKLNEDKRNIIMGSYKKIGRYQSKLNHKIII